MLGVPRRHQPGACAHVRPRMVEGLANRPEKMPNDEEGWTKSIRSQTMLGKFDAAANELRRRLDAFLDGTRARARIVGAAKDFGVAKW